PVLLIAAGVALCLLMDLAIPWRPLVSPRWKSTKSAGHSFRIVTCNCHGKAALDTLASELAPDIIVLQEWPQNHSPRLARDNAWNIRRDGELLIATRFPIVSAEDCREPGWAKWGGSARRYDLRTPDGTPHLLTIHIASPPRPSEAAIHNKAGRIEWLQTHQLIRA